MAYGIKRLTFKVSFQRSVLVPSYCLLGHQIRWDIFREFSNTTEIRCFENFNPHYKLTAEKRVTSLGISISNWARRRDKTKEKQKQIIILWMGHEH